MAEKLRTNFKIGDILSPEDVNRTNATINANLDSIKATEDAATSAATSASNAAQAAEDASGYLSDLQDAIQDLPDGQAVSAQVAENTADLLPLKGKTTGDTTSSVFKVANSSNNKVMDIDQTGTLHTVHIESDDIKKNFSALHDLVYQTHKELTQEAEIAQTENEAKAAELQEGIDNVQSNIDTLGEHTDSMISKDNNNEVFDYRDKYGNKVVQRSPRLFSLNEITSSATFKGYGFNVNQRQSGSYIKESCRVMAASGCKIVRLGANAYFNAASAYWVKYYGMKLLVTLIITDTTSHYNNVIELLNGKTYLNCKPVEGESLGYRIVNGQFLKDVNNNAIDEEGNIIGTAWVSNVPIDATVCADFYQLGNEIDLITEMTVQALFDNCEVLSNRCRKANPLAKVVLVSFASISSISQKIDDYPTYTTSGTLIDSLFDMWSWHQYTNKDCPDIDMGRVFTKYPSLKVKPFIITECNIAASATTSYESVIANLPAYLAGLRCYNPEYIIIYKLFGNLANSGVTDNNQRFYNLLEPPLKSPKFKFTNDSDVPQYPYLDSWIYGIDNWGFPTPRRMFEWKSNTGSVRLHCVGAKINLITGYSSKANAEADTNGTILLDTPQTFSEEGYISLTITSSTAFLIIDYEALPTYDDSWDYSKPDPVLDSSIIQCMSVLGEGTLVSKKDYGYEIFNGSYIDMVLPESVGNYNIGNGNIYDKDGNLANSLSTNNINYVQKIWQQ